MEIRSITISGTQAKASLAKIAIVIKHENDVHETFKTEAQGNKATAECKTYVDRCSTVSIDSSIF